MDRGNGRDRSGETDLFGRTRRDDGDDPALWPRAALVMDNLAAHKVDGVRSRVEAAGAELRYLPPYSPDVNPIEKCWSQVKQRLRALKARLLLTLEQALTEAPSVVTPQNIQAYFRRCGYGL